MQKVNLVEITSANDYWIEDTERQARLSQAMIYVGDEKIATLPIKIESDKTYSYPCNATGKFVKIVAYKSEMEKIELRDSTASTDLETFSPIDAIDGRKKLVAENCTGYRCKGYRGS